jgi:catechol 2,3-dioxygenase-like lactoylglutathione lyase family enzyme
MAATDTGTHVYEVGVVIVPVSDQDKALEFYTEKLGFETRADVPFGDGNRWLEVAPKGAPTRIALMPPREGDESSVGRETGIAFGTEDAEGDHEQLRSSGVDVDEEVQRMGGPVPPMFWFRDQDGNSLLIVEQRSSDS